jgi:hypothetical protein
MGANPVGADARLADPQSAEQQLADKYAPVAMLKRQDRPCDSHGEPFAPAPVEVVLGDPATTLRDNAGGGAVVAPGPTGADIYFGGPDLYLDLPGNPRDPGCAYEQHFKARTDNRPAVAYARIATSGLTGQLALQYWLYYYFNDFNNTHESDWEMIQLLFNATSAADALGQEPVEIALAQHGGGENAEWIDNKLQRDGSRPIIYVAAGSHATYYDSGIFLGWGENGAGFGCDDTSGPSNRVPLDVLLIPDGVPDRDGPFAWTTFRGRWGEKQPWEYNGPTGPNTKPQWSAPFHWQAGLRDSSLKIEGVTMFGPGPAQLFCEVVGFGAMLLTRYQVYPWLIGLTAAAIVVGLLVLAIVGRTTLAAATDIYGEYPHLFIPLGLLIIPIGIAATGLQYLVIEYPPGKQIFEVMNKSPGARLAAALTVGGFQQLAGLIVIGPTVIVLVSDIQAGRTPSLRRAYEVVLAGIGRLAAAVLGLVVIVGLLELSVVGIPWAVTRAVRWFFVAQAAIVDRATPKEARARSARAVSGHWWRTVSIVFFLTVLGNVAGPLIGIYLLVFDARSVEFVNLVSSLVYAALLPLSVVGYTQLYQQLERGHWRGVTRETHTRSAPLRITPEPPSRTGQDPPDRSQS